MKWHTCTICFTIVLISDLIVSRVDSFMNLDIFTKSEEVTVIYN